jgi:hypothetical protein
MEVVTTPVVVEETPQVPVVDPVAELNKELERLETELTAMLPVQLFFDNDQPNPGTKATTTVISYDATVQGYTARKATYVQQYGGAADTFFTDRVNKGYSQLNGALASVKKLLENGRTVTVELKGFTSPLAPSAYNEALSQRRIASVENYLGTWMNGALASYISSGKLVLKRTPLGESTAPATVSDKTTDLKGSVFSPAAAYERRVEIIAIGAE